MTKFKAILLLSVLPLSLPAQTRGTGVSNYDYSGNPYSVLNVPGSGAWNVAAGGTIVGCARFAGSNVTLSVTDTGGANSFVVTNYAAVGGNTRVAMFKAENTRAVAADVLSIHFSSSTGYVGGAAVQYSGTAAAAYDSGSTGSANAGTSVSTGTFSTTQGPEIVVACGGDTSAALSPGTLSTNPPTAMSAALSPVPAGGTLLIEDGNLFQKATGITAGMNAAGGDQFGIVAGTFKSSNTTSPPVLSEAFSNVSGSIQGVSYIYAGGTATVSFTVTNPNAAASLSGINFSDTLPAGMVLANPVSSAGSCPAGTVAATAGGSTVSLSGAALPAAGSCTFSVNVTSATVSAEVNTTGNVTSVEGGNGGTATATLVVYGAPAIAISNIVISAVDHASVNVSWSVNTTGYCQLQYGTSSGVYQYSSGSQGSDVVASHSCTMSLGGLNPSTTYYVMPTARPNANSSAGICYVGGSCGSTEQSFTTLPLPNPHPAPPNPPTVWTPTFPDTSGYTIVTMQADPVTGNCEAAANVAKQTKWTSAVTAGDSFQQVINEIWFDTIIEFPETLSCNIPASGSFHTGVTLPAYSPSGGPNDWVIIRTHANAAADFPPPGVRTGPQFAAKLATLVAQTPGMPLTPGNGQQNFNGQIFDCYMNGCNHFWVVNIAMTHAFNSTLYPPGVTDPPAFVHYVRVQSPVGNTSVDTCPSATTPCYTVLDRVYAYGQPWPSREMGCFEPGGNYWAVMNTYCTTNFWVPGVWPAVSPVNSSLNNAVIDIPNAFYQLNAHDNTPLGIVTASGYSGTTSNLTPNAVGTGSYTFTTQTGLTYKPGDLVEAVSASASYAYMIGTVTSYNASTGQMVAAFTGASDAGATNPTWNIVTPAIATFSGVSTYAGKIYAWLSSAGLTIEYQTAAGVSVACNTGAGNTCNTVAVATPANTDVPASALGFFNGHFNGSGSFVLDGSLGGSVNPSIFTQFRPLGVYWQPGQYGLYDNNYMVAIGQTIYNDTSGPAEDIAWTHNYLYFPRSKMQYSGQWDGYGYSFRNVIETKQQLRGLYQGNIIDGSASFQNPGNAIYIAGSWTGPWSTGTQDINITSNIFKHISTGFQMAGGGTSPTDPPAATRVGITNNLFLDLNRDLYNNVGFGLASGSFSLYPMASDVNFSNNTVGLTLGSGPSLLEFGGADQTTVMGEGLLYSNNVVLTSLGGLDVMMSIDGGQNSSYSNFPTNPTVAAGVNPPSPPGTWAAALNTDFIHVGNTISPSWSIGHNVIIGAKNNRGLPAGTWVDLTPAQINSSILQMWPSSDRTSVFPCSSSDAHGAGVTTLAGRLSAVGWSPTMDLASGNPKPYTIVPSIYNPGNIGANVTLVNQAAGVVEGISLNKGPGFLQFSYIAPDTRACSVDISPDGMAWSRMTDTGGSFSRSLTFTGLTPNTPYQYRIMCYFDQSAAYEFLPSEITSGTIVTSVGTPRVVFQNFKLPAGATKAVFDFTGADGSQVSQTCLSSPCSVNLDVGTWTRTLTFETNSSSIVGVKSTTNIAVQ